MLGNIACAEGALRAGCRFFAGYPITPANEIAHYMSQELPKVGGYYVQ
ncbi:MAG TPA: 2-oxoacid:acceptor oxidoreductase subunit alpha, partial [Candidatus Bathyarchaeota archaeon]|nr:2-oxoacid:acceptor oxidoreductase subunit alpha [Candidatus Bathyarchaeota archaeon]